MTTHTHRIRRTGSGATTAAGAVTVIWLALALGALVAAVGAEVPPSITPTPSAGAPSVSHDHGS